MKAAVYQGDRRFEIKDVPVPKAGEGQVLVEVKFCGICGTDVHGFMFDVIQPGSIIGHEVSGTIVEIGPGVTAWKVGDRVAGGGGEAPPGTANPFLDHPRYKYSTMGWQSKEGRAHSYAEFVRMAEWEPVLIPEGVSDAAASMTEPMATSILAIRRSGLKLGDWVGILGAGPIGLFCLQAAKASGASKVIVVEPAQARRQLARRLGADEIIDPTTSDSVLELASLTDGRGPHVVFDCAGAKDTLQTALASVRQGGLVAVVALCWEPSPVLPVDWITRDLNLTTVFGYGPEDWRIGFELIQNGKVNPEAMLNDNSIIDLDDIQEAFDALLNPTNQLKILVQP